MAPVTSDLSVLLRRRSGKLARIRPTKLNRKEETREAKGSVPRLGLKNRAQGSYAGRYAAVHHRTVTRRHQPAAGGVPGRSREEYYPGTARVPTCTGGIPALLLLPPARAGTSFFAPGLVPVSLREPGLFAVSLHAGWADARLLSFYSAVADVGCVIGRPDTCPADLVCP